MAPKDIVINLQNLSMQKSSSLEGPGLFATSHEREKPPLKSEDTPTDEEGYTLMAYGEISLSNIDFLPLSVPPGAETPEKTYTWDEKKKKFSDRRSVPLVIRRVLPPRPAKASVRKREPSFEALFETLKHVRSEEARKAAPDATSGGLPSSSIPTKGPHDQHKQLIDASEAEIAEQGSHGVVQNRELIRGSDGQKQCGDVNGQSNPGVVMNKDPKQNEVRSKGRLPKQPPIPRWDDDNVAGSQGRESGLGLVL